MNNPNVLFYDRKCINQVTIQIIWLKSYRNGTATYILNLPSYILPLPQAHTFTKCHT